MNKLEKKYNLKLSGNEIFYTCDPEENGEHFYVGFLTKSKNPFGQLDKFCRLLSCGCFIVGW